jgi:hypothetical protein
MLKGQDQQKRYLDFHRIKITYIYLKIVMPLTAGQTQRINRKLLEAKKADKNLKVFGASYHKYQVNPPVKSEIITQFEQQYNVRLPDCYKAFLLEVGNGGISHAGSAAGPFYGIYPFGVHIDELIYVTTGIHLQYPCLIYPGMSEDYWRTLHPRTDTNGGVEEKDERDREKAFGGILPIGSQGCAYSHGIVLNGEHSGRIVNLDYDGQKPHFSYEANFLDWYERWLDEVISGELLKPGPNWFGYAMRMTDKEATQVLREYETIRQRNDRKMWFQFWK